MDFDYNNDNIIALFAVGDIDFGVYTAASGDYCVVVNKYGHENEYYNCGHDIDSAFKFVGEYCKDNN